MGGMGVREHFLVVASMLNLNGQKEIPDKTAAHVQAEKRHLQMS